MTSPAVEVHPFYDKVGTCPLPPLVEAPQTERLLGDTDAARRLGIWKPADAGAWLSPFHYFRAMVLLMGRPFALSHFAVLFVAGAVSMALASVVFARRDL